MAVKTNCNSCEFNCGGICGGHGSIADMHDTYGMNIKSTLGLFPKGCDDYGVSLASFIKQIKQEGEKSGHISHFNT